MLCVTIEEFLAGFFTIFYIIFFEFNKAKHTPGDITHQKIYMIGIKSFKNLYSWCQSFKFNKYFSNWTKRILQIASEGEVEITSISSINLFMFDDCFTTHLFHVSPALQKKLKVSEFLWVLKWVKGSMKTSIECYFFMKGFLCARRVGFLETINIEIRKKTKNEK